MCHSADQGSNLMISAQTDRYALSHDTGLLHAAWSTKLLHVFAEVAVATLFARTCLTLPAACPSAPGIRWTATGRELHSSCCRPWSSRWRRAHLCFWPIKWPWLKHIEPQNYLSKSQRKMRSKIKLFSTRFTCKELLFIYYIYIALFWALKALYIKGVGESPLPTPVLCSILNIFGNQNMMNITGLWAACLLTLTVTKCNAT